MDAKRLNITVRPIGTRLSASCIRVQKNDGFSHAYYLSEERIRKLHANGERFFGAFTVDGSLIGFASVNVDLVRMRIHFFCVDRSFHGQGVGSMLLAHIVTIGRRERVRMMYTYTEVNSPLERFFLAKGFVKAGYFRNRFDNRDATILSSDLER